MRYILIFLITASLCCTTGKRNNPFDSRGNNWNPPEVTVMSDTSVNINDSLEVTATTEDNGTIASYIWAKNGLTYADTTDIPSLEVAFSDSGRHILMVTVVDDDGVVSAPDSCEITVTLDAPVLSVKNDTTVSFSTTTMVTVSGIAVDTNASGNIEKYYWDLDADGWDDSTDTDLYTVETTAGSPITIRWAARDDDGVFSQDTFMLFFNHPPASISFTSPTSKNDWVSFALLDGKGTLPLSFSADDPDEKDDTLTYTLSVGPQVESLSRVYTGNDTTYNLTTVDSSSTLYYRLVVTDPFGDSLVSTGVMTTPPPPCIDADSNIYQTVIIGYQEWTIENIRATKYIDGTSIPYVTDNTIWKDLSTPGYCYYDNKGSTTFRKRYGVLYNWYAVNAGKLALEPWHVPSDSDWIALRDYLGGPTLAGAKLKDTDTIDWLPPNTGATNESGFTALPGGFRHVDGHYRSNGEYGYWWSSTEADQNQGYSYRLENYNTVMRDSDNHKQYGFSVRLVRNLD